MSCHVKIYQKYFLCNRIVLLCCSVGPEKFTKSFVSRWPKIPEDNNLNVQEIIDDRAVNSHQTRQDNQIDPTSAKPVRGVQRADREKRSEDWAQRGSREGGREKGGYSNWRVAVFPRGLVVAGQFLRVLPLNSILWVIDWVVIFPLFSKGK